MNLIGLGLKGLTFIVKIDLFFGKFNITINYIFFFLNLA